MAKIDSKTVQNLFRNLLSNPNAQAGLASFLSGVGQTVQGSLAKGDNQRAQRVIGTVIQLAPLIAAAALANTPAEPEAGPEAVKEAKATAASGA